MDRQMTKRIKQNKKDKRNRWTFDADIRGFQVDFKITELNTNENEKNVIRILESMKNNETPILGVKSKLTNTDMTQIWQEIKNRRRKAQWIRKALRKSPEDTDYEGSCDGS